MLILDKLAELSADCIAALVSGLQSLRPASPRIWISALVRKTIGATRSLFLVALKRVLPMFPWGKAPPRSTREYLVSSARLARSSFILGARVTPVVWRVSQDPRSRGILAMVLRVIFGRPTRRPRPE